MDPSTIATGLTIAKQAFDLVKGAKDMAAEGKTTEADERLAAALQALTEVLYRQGELIIEINKANEEIRELKAKMATSEVVQFRYDAYWKNRSGGGLDGPFSTGTWDNDGKLVRLKASGSLDQSKSAIYFVSIDGNECTTVPVPFLRENNVLTDSEISHVLGG